METVKNLAQSLTVSDAAYKGPGRLGDPSMNLETDPRSNPDLIKALKAMQLTTNQETRPNLTDDAEIERVLRTSNNGFEAMYANMPDDLPGDASEPEVDEEEITVDGLDGNKVKIYVFKAKDSSSEPKPGVLYIHGGGMTIIGTRMKPHLRWVRSLALLGTVAILVDFRNAWQADGQHYPFPAGLNDCVAAVKYVNAHRSELGISKVVLQGESGGGNLCLATALKANREGWINAIDGVYGSVPSISGADQWPDSRKLKELPSLKENEGYLLDAGTMSVLTKWYSPGEGELENPLAWPYHATMADMKGLPPHFMSMDELDPLRDEGISYARRLCAAGVRSTSEVNLGITHASSLIFRQALPEVHEKALRHIAAFAKSL